MFAPYTFRLAIESLWREKWINLLSALTIATGLFIMAVAAVSVYNVRLATKRLPEKFSMTVFLSDGLSEEKAREALALIKKKTAVKEAKYISKEAALKELKALLKDSDYVLEGLDENPLPASVEISLKREAVTESSVRGLSDELKAIEGITDVSYGQKFLASIQAIKAGAEGVGALLAGVLSIGVLFVCYSTVKILFYRKKEEMETLRLLGATRWFIRAPFIIEGGAIGAFAGGAALALMAGLRYAALGRLSSIVPIAGSIAYPPEVLFYLPFSGLLIGVLGALIAIGRLRF